MEENFDSEIRNITIGSLFYWKCLTFLKKSARTLGP